MYISFLAMENSDLACTYPSRDRLSVLNRRGPNSSGTVCFTFPHSPFPRLTSYSGVVPPPPLSLPLLLRTTPYCMMDRPKPRGQHSCIARIVTVPTSTIGLNLVDTSRTTPELQKTPGWLGCQRRDNYKARQVFKRLGR